MVLEERSATAASGNGRIPDDGRDFPEGVTVSMSRFLSRMTAGFLLAAALLLAACGGGGGGGGSGGGGGGNLPAFVYAGNTNAAVVTTDNAAKLIANLISSDSAAGAIVGVSVEGSESPQIRGGGHTDLSRRLSRIFSDSVVRAKGASTAQRVAPAVLVNETELCDGGVGSVLTVGTLNDIDGTGTLTVTFSGCLIDGLTLNGQATVRVDAFAQFFGPIDFTFNFARLTLRGTGVSVDVSGSLHVRLFFVIPNSEEITANLVSLNNNTNKMTQSVNLVFLNVYNSSISPTSFTATVSGRLFDQDHGYVEITTPTQLVFGTIDQLFPDSGQMLLTGSANRSVRVTALSATLARLALDLNGDSVVDNIVTLKWTDLSGPVASDLADDDSDGMPNSWETANGLNPNNSTDAALDNDSDGAINLIEYLAGTDPNNSSSIPPAGPVLGSFLGQVINLPANSYLMFDSVTQKIYAAVRGNPGAITPIDPTTGNLGPAIPVGVDPAKLARSDNGQYLYVGLDGESAIQRIDLATQMVNLKFILASEPPFTGPLFVEDMEALPGSPQSIAVSRKDGDRNHAGVAIFDDNVQRASTTTGSNVIEFSASAGTLFGYNNRSTGFGFSRMAVSPSGVSVLDVFDSFMGDLIQGFNVDIKFHSGLIYTTTGRVIDPVARTVAGTFSLPSTFGNLVEPDAAIGRVYFLTRDGFSGTWSIRVFDLITRQLLMIVDIPGVTGDPGNLIRWGTKGLAFRTSDGQIFLIQSLL